MFKFGYISSDYSNPTNVFYCSDKSDDDSDKNDNDFENSED